MAESNERALRQNYSEIIHGFSIANFNNRIIYIRHFSSLDNLEIDFLYNDELRKAIAKKYPVESERLSQLNRDSLWTSGDENNIEGIKAYIRTLLLAKKKVFLSKDIQSMNQQIKEQEKLLNEMLTKRELLIGQTAEKATKRKVDARLIFKSFFSDIEFKHPLYTEEEFEDLEPLEMSELFFTYNTMMENFSELNIKKISLASFFQNAFYLTESIYEFYGKPICFLSNFQIQLTAYGRYYKAILSGDAKPPDELLNDPDKLEDWHSGKTNADQLLDKTQAGEGESVSIMGATQEDLKNWGYDQQSNSIFKATQEAGGMMDMEALLKFQGIE